MPLKPVTPDPQRVLLGGVGGEQPHLDDLAVDHAQHVDTNAVQCTGAATISPASTETLRDLERDGLVTRHEFAEVLVNRERYDAR